MCEIFGYHIVKLDYKQIDKILNSVSPPDIATGASLHRNARNRPFIRQWLGKTHLCWSAVVSYRSAPLFPASGDLSAKTPILEKGMYQQLTCSPRVVSRRLFMILTA